MTETTNEYMTILLTVERPGKPKLSFGYRMDTDIYNQIGSTYQEEQVLKKYMRRLEVDLLRKIR